METSLMSSLNKIYGWCLRVCITLKKHHDHKASWEERVYLAYTSTSLFITDGNQDSKSSRAGNLRQALPQRPWRGLHLIGLLSIAFSACFHIEARILNPGVAP